MMSLRSLIAEAQIALMLLTRLPAGPLPRPAPTIPQSGWAFPLAGLAIGLIGALVLWAGRASGLPSAIVAGFAVASGIVATGALHEDGLADVADGFGGGRDPAHKLAIMRDSRIGSYGALALILVIGLRWQLLAALATPTALIAAAVLSRGALPTVMALMPAARADGLGRQAAAATFMTALTAAALSLGLAAVCVDPVSALAMAAAAAAATALVALIARRQIGGQTGDVLGAMQQLSELAALTVALTVTPTV